MLCDPAASIAATAKIAIPEMYTLFRPIMSDSLPIGRMSALIASPSATTTHWAVDRSRVEVLGDGRQRHGHAAMVDHRCQRPQGNSGEHPPLVGGSIEYARGEHERLFYRNCVIRAGGASFGDLHGSSSGSPGRKPLTRDYAAPRLTSSGSRTPASAKPLALNTQLSHWPQGIASPL